MPKASSARLVVSKFDTIPACDGQTDDSIYRASIALRGKTDEAMA